MGKDTGIIAMRGRRVVEEMRFVFLTFFRMVPFAVFSVFLERDTDDLLPQPVNSLSLVQPASSPLYTTFASRIIETADPQANIFLQQNLEVEGAEERGRIVDVICARGGGEMMMHRRVRQLGGTGLEAAAGPEERRKIVACMRYVLFQAPNWTVLRSSRVVDLDTNCYGCHVLQRLLMGDPVQTLIMELSWTPPAPPLFAHVNNSLKGKWASLACHETGSLVVQHAFENLGESAKDGLVDELLGQGSAVFGEVAQSQWGLYCMQHILHLSDKHGQIALEHLLAGLLEFRDSTHPYAYETAHARVSILCIKQGKKRGQQEKTAVIDNKSHEWTRGLYVLFPQVSLVDGFQIVEQRSHALTEAMRRLPIIAEDTGVHAVE
ncbi:hypothetical protein C8F04DRAFT_1265341 [Mycena alexandri]|uniref:PUM-HD domain-containing protein n=1 Tax=Mycena alexandri TaxID=1745969 RepID=A0AAD6WY97_9AGAR|nr:hypothetical protein C8F04DRAFT_1265341 [Mycena alexandri]